ncbi:hypothetical protein HU200_067029 [Digitaria exilis]|uniref:Uncharacterized protein n=1 Tax=Digitaria exilis TaxID=1010633 RepID=A0A835DWL5_9POAL|nr:hypothetical protein HU200_067029 [Digitaria exilis]
MDRRQQGEKPRKRRPWRLGDDGGHEEAAGACDAAPSARFSPCSTPSMLPQLHVAVQLFDDVIACNISPEVDQWTTSFDDKSLVRKSNSTTTAGSGGQDDRTSQA